MAAHSCEVDNLKQRLKFFIVSTIILGILFISCLGLIAWLIHTDSRHVEGRSFVESEENVQIAKVGLPVRVEMNEYFN